MYTVIEEMMEDQVVYPNAPLKEIDFEIRFDGDINIISNMNMIQREFKSTFPQLFVPIINSVGQPYDLEPYNFRSVDDQKGILVSINKFGYYSREYNGYMNFRKELNNNLDVFFNIIDSIEKFNRIGLRYNNFIPYSLKHEIIPLYNKLKMQHENKIFSSDIVDVNMSYCFKTQNDYLSMMIKPTQVFNQSFLELDFDFWSDNQIDRSQINTFIDKGHECIKNFFMNLITEDFKLYMKGLS